MPFFRPYPLMTVLSVAALAVLCTLGWWQLERLQWKLDLIASVESRASSDPISVDALLRNVDSAEWEYAPVTVTGTFQHNSEMHVFGQNLSGHVGWFIFTPLQRSDGSTIIINRGFVPEPLKDPNTRNEGQVPGEVTITGLARRDAESNAFTPPPNADTNEWYMRNLEAMAVHLGLTDVVPVFVDARDDAPGGWPQGGQTRLEFSNSHLGYALTWFGLALTLIGVYIAYHWQKGRFGRQKKA